jgi:hypothetical protein
VATLKRKKTPARRKQRRWLIPKMLLVLACGVLITFIGAILLMRQELHRIGLFGGGNAPTSSAVQAPEPPSPLTGKEARPRVPSSPSAAEELTQDEKKQLDDVLRSRGSR